MKKFGISVGLALAVGLFAAAGCNFTGAYVSGADLYGGGFASPSEEDLNGGAPQTENGSQNEDNETQDKGTCSARLAVLDAIDVPAAFGVSDAEEWSFALNASGDLAASYGFVLTSELSDSEKLNLEYGAGIGLEDLIGVRSKDNAQGAELFGGGEVSLSLYYRGPYGDSDPASKTFAAGFRHDGDFVAYAGEDGKELKTSLSELKEKIGEAAMTETFERMENAFAVIPEELEKGVSLRFAVEKLIDMGFAAEIDDTDGITLSLRANAGFYTGLINDMFEEFIPAEWLDYIPRVDLGYEKTFFDIELSFDANGRFREYSMSSDVALTASLRVRNVFCAASGLNIGGGLAFTAYEGEVPGYGGAQPEA